MPIAGNTKYCCFTGEKYYIAVFEHSQPYASFMKLLLQLIVTGVILILNQPPAHAITVTNLASVPHRVTARMPGDQTSTLLVPPGGTVHLTAFPEAKLSLATAPGSPPLTAREKDNFTIWPDGTFGPQIRRKFRSIDPH